MVESRLIFLTKAILIFRKVDLSTHAVSLLMEGFIIALSLLLNQ